MSDWHFGMDYDMWLFPPVDGTAPDYDYELPEPIEAADIEGILLINAEDAIEQVRYLQAENAKLRELCAEMFDAVKCCCGEWCAETASSCDNNECGWRKCYVALCEMGIEV